MQLDAYIRVSRVGARDTEAESFRSVEDQRSAIQAWALSNGHEIIAEHVELDQSGKAASRPMFDLVMRRIAARQTDGVITAYRSWFGRSMLNNLLAIRDI